MSDSSSYTPTLKRRYGRTKEAWEIIKTLAGVRPGSQDVYAADILLEAIKNGTAKVTVEWIQDSSK